MADDRFPGMQESDVRMSATLWSALFAGGSMVAACFLQMGLGGEVTFAAVWVATLLLGLPVLHGGRRHGLRALALTGVAPVLVGVTHAAIERPLTSAWSHTCGMFVVGFLALPFVVAVLVVGAGALSALARGGRRLEVALAAMAILVALGIALTWGLARPAPSAHHRLIHEVTSLAPLPDLAGLGELSIAGSRITRRCGQGADATSCVVAVDGIEGDRLDEAEGLELAEGLGYRFLRPTDALRDPSRWYAYQPGARFGTQLDARDLGGVAAPRGLGGAFLFSSLVASFYLAAALARVRRVAQLRASVAARVIEVGVVSVGPHVAPCDPSIALGPATLLGTIDGVATYRSRDALRGQLLPGTKAALIEAEWDAAAQHLVLVAASLILGAIPMLVALSSGLTPCL